MPETKFTLSKLLHLPHSSVIAMGIIAILGLSTGFITYESESDSASGHKTSLDATLPEMSKGAIKDNKYDNIHLTENPVDSSFFSDTYASLAEKEKKHQQSSNEDLSIEQIARQNGLRETNWQSRQQVSSHYNAQMDNISQQNRKSIQQITQPAPLSAEDLAERRSRDEALERAAHMEQLAINQMENLNNASRQQDSYRQQDRYSDFSGNTVDRAVGPPITSVTVANLDKYVQIPKETSHQNVFYGMKGEQKKPEMVAAQPVPNSIEAVIHGDADNISITNGSTVKIRILQAIQVGKYLLPENSILTGECGISGERIHVVISSIRIQNSIIPVKLLAYDIDGHVGIYVPNLASKQQIAQTGSQAVTGGSINMPYMVPTNSSVGEMVVGQTASQGVNLAINGARSLVARRMTQQKAIVRPNYRIYLKQQEQ